MRTYGLRTRGKNQHCGWGCCYCPAQGYIVFGRNARTRNALKRLFKRRARREAHQEILRQLKDKDE
jgi:hypothetical protein